LLITHDSTISKNPELSIMKVKTAISSKRQDSSPIIAASTPLFLNIFLNQIDQSLDIQSTRGITAFKKAIG
jgi:hypothetical protein